MIETLKFNSNINFKGNEERVTTNQGEVKEKKIDSKAIYEKTKATALDIFKKANDITGVTGGVATGVTKGILATGGVAIVGKALANAKNEKGFKVFSSIAINILKDAGKAIKNGTKYAYNFFTEDKSIAKHLKDLALAPNKFYKNYLKGHKGVGILATTIGAGVMAFYTIGGKIKANEKNADLDHKLKHGHID